MATNNTSGSDDVKNKVVIITGGNSGIGYGTALELARRGAQVILACRNQNLGDEAVEKIKAETKNDKIYMELLDLADLQSVRDFVKSFTAKWDQLHILINNAGVAAEKRTLTKDGFELCFGTNHLGHFLLTNLLLDLLKKSTPSRIINVSSDAYKWGTMHWDDLNSEKSFSAMRVYSHSKLANVLFTVELAKRLEGTNVTAVSLHPGFVATNITSHMSPGIMSSIVKFGVKLLGKSLDQGSKTSVFCATEASIPQHSGVYYSDSKVENLQNKAKSPEDALKLWELSVKFVGLEN